jgi:hypothetical protein
LGIASPFAVSGIDVDLSQRFKRPIEEVPIDSWKPGYRTIGIYRHKCCDRVDLGLGLNEVRKRSDFML